MKGLLLLVVAIAALAVVVAKFGASVNPTAEVAQAIKVAAPLDINYRWERGFLGMGVYEYMLLTNKSEKPLAVVDAQVIRPGDKRYRIEGVPAILKPFETIQVRLRESAWKSFLLTKGDAIEVKCDGFPIPARANFAE